MGHESTIVYFLITNFEIVSEFEVLDNFVNLSDHLPLCVKCACNIDSCHAVDLVDSLFIVCTEIMPTCRCTEMSWPLFAFYFAGAFFSENNDNVNAELVEGVYC